MQSCVRRAVAVVRSFDGLPDNMFIALIVLLVLYALRQFVQLLEVLRGTMNSAENWTDEMARLQAQVKDETQTWLKIEAVRRKITIGELIDQMVEEAQEQEKSSQKKDQ